MDVVVNAATSIDGKLSSRRREQIAISGSEDFDRVDQLRADSDAVMIGVGTVLADDPSLTVDDEARIATRRQRGDPDQPARVIADSQLRTPEDARVLDDAAHTFLLASEAAEADIVEARDADGVTVIVAGRERVDLPTAVERLDTAGVDQLMVEGGGELIFSLFEAGLVDELSVFVGPKILGGREAPTLADGPGFVDSFPELELADVDRLDDGVLLTWR